MPNLFGTDGIRGRSNKEMTPSWLTSWGKPLRFYYGKDR